MFHDKNRGGGGEGRTRVRLTETANEQLTLDERAINLNQIVSRVTVVFLSGKDPLIGSLFSQGEIMKEGNMEI